jgi:hypothetical protein
MYLAVGEISRVNCNGYYQAGENQACECEQYRQHSGGFFCRMEITVPDGGRINECVIKRCHQRPSFDPANQVTNQANLHQQKQQHRASQKQVVKSEA